MELKQNLDWNRIKSPLDKHRDQRGRGGFFKSNQ
jgi:hypothetical protein